SFCFRLYCDHRDLPSFPTRRSSDLRRSRAKSLLTTTASARRSELNGSRRRPEGRTWSLRSSSFTSTILKSRCSWRCWKPSSNRRSEEHTSELQSRSDLVCRLLLEKK